jgi:hypothetical protein
MIRRCRTFSKIKNPASGVLNNHFGTNKYRAEGSHTRLQQSLQVVQKKARLLTRPTPARQDAPFRGQGRSERRGEIVLAPYAEPLSDERMMLAGFFNSLLERMVGRGNSKEHRAVTRKLGR